ncbi:CoA transferase, partial [Litorivivens sp.]
EHQVPHAPILGITEALNQPQAKARNMVVETDHKTLGTIPIVNRPIKYPGADQAIPSAPPVLGQNTNEVLADILNLDEARIGELRSRNIVG